MNDWNAVLHPIMAHPLNKIDELLSGNIALCCLAEGLVTRSRIFYERPELFRRTIAP